MDERTYERRNERTNATAKTLEQVSNEIQRNKQRSKASFLTDTNFDAKRNETNEGKSQTNQAANIPAGINKRQLYSLASDGMTNN